MDVGTGFRAKENDREENLYGSLVQLNERSVMPSRKNIALFTPQKVHSQQLSLEKVHTRTQTVTRSGQEVTCANQRDLNSSDEAELTYPP